MAGLPNGRVPGFEPYDMSKVPGFGDTSAPVQHFQAGVEEVFPLTGTMTGLDAKALAGRQKAGNTTQQAEKTIGMKAGGVPQKHAKGTSKVKGGAKQAAAGPSLIPTQVAPPAGTMPVGSMPQMPMPSYPGGSFL